jgi:hypothetical protein
LPLTALFLILKYLLKPRLLQKWQQKTKCAFKSIIELFDKITLKKFKRVLQTSLKTKMEVKPKKCAKHSKMSLVSTKVKQKGDELIFPKVLLGFP